ncbi:hypothetical protein BP5796_06669 [Coleophoma crateriformis]|uniref:Zn(2)-C6 fungal-type domain-containing protein n=1 Tax=Coleophoma crateriformis TaxID=565419 RepID=A0A3D8RPG8_9HELO|nr:hypothetical protein BP5796_06669 [Coleophoma crateriformis]
MDDWSLPPPPAPLTHSDSTQSSPNNDKHSTTKQAACLSCRRSKTRCLRGAEDSKCKRCLQTDSECVIPDYHVGRRKGVKNKRVGLDKAVHYIEKVIKTSHKQGAEHGDDERTAAHLHNLLKEAQSLLPRNGTNTEMSPGIHSQTTSSQSDHVHKNGPADRGASYSISTDAPQRPGVDDGFAIDDAENPLQLLARASHLTEPQPSHSPDGPQPVTMPAYLEATRDSTLINFFGCFRSHLDVGEDIDPVDMGFVTSEEVDILFSFFYQNLAHTRWGLDPLVHTSSFVRRRSAFLFTSILSASALFIPTAAALSKRLSVHCRHLAHNVMVHRYRSLEIVLAFMVNVPWMAPGKHWSDDESCSYVAMASAIAIDLSMNKLVMPSPSIYSADIPATTPKSDCISARKALDIDGFPETDPHSPQGRRLLRARERVWLALFVLDRGVCLARGRDFTVPLSPLLAICDKWHESNIADTWDGSIISSAVLRRDLAGLIENIKLSCASDRISTAEGSVVAQSIQGMIDDFFNRWYGTWAFAVKGNKDNHSLPPYVEILASHTRLSTYSTVINLPTAPVEVTRFFRAAGLSASLNVMRAAVQGESQLKSMPNNTVIMISFSACFALYLSTMAEGSNSSLASSIRILIEEAADVLERIGATPEHRNATSSLYGRHLREIVKNSSPAPAQRADAHGNGPQSEPMPMPQNQYPGQQNSIITDPAMLMPEHMQFSAMSDYQIVEAVNNAGNDLEMYPHQIHIDDTAGLDWLDWFNFHSNTV